MKPVAALDNKTYFNIITRYYGLVIRVRSNSGVVPGSRQMVINDQEANAFSTTTGSSQKNAANEVQSEDLLAGTMYRYARLGDLYIRFGYKHPNYAKDHPGEPVPSYAWDSEAIQRQAAAMEFKLLHDLGASKPTLKLAERLAYDDTPLLIEP